MAGEVTMVFTADEAAAWKAIQKLQAGTAKLNDSMDKTGQSAARAGAAMKRKGEVGLNALQSMAAPLIGIIASYASLEAIVSKVTDAIREQKQVGIDASNAMNDIGKAQEDALKNFAGLSAGDKTKAFAAAKQIQQSTGFPSEAALVTALGATYAAVQDLPTDIKAVATAASLTKGNEQDMKGFATGMLDLSNTTGVKDTDVLASFLLQSGSINRVERPTAISSNLAPIVGNAALAAPQQNPEEMAKETASLFSLLASRGTDVEGKTSAHAAGQLISKTAEFFKGNANDPGTILGRFEKIRNDPALRKRFEKLNFGDEKYSPMFSAIMDPKSGMFDDLKAGADKLKFDRSEFDATLADRNLTAEMRNMDASLALRGSSEQALTSDHLKAARGTLDRDIPGILRNTAADIGDLLSESVDLGYYGRPQEQYYREKLQQREVQLLSRAGLKPRDGGAVVMGQTTAADFGGYFPEDIPQDISTQLQSVQNALQTIDKLFGALDKAADRIAGTKTDIDYATRGRREAATTLDRE